MSKNRTVTLNSLPFEAGQGAELIVLPSPSPAREGRSYPLRGHAIRYEKPTEPVALEEW